MTFALAEAPSGAVRVQCKGEIPLKASALLAAPATEGQRRKMMALLDAVTELLVEKGGEWEGQPQELLDALEVTTSAILPERPDELTKRLRKLAAPQETFSVRPTRKRAGETNEKVVRWLRLAFHE